MITRIEDDHFFFVLGGYLFWRVDFGTLPESCLDHVAPRRLNQARLNVTFKSPTTEPLKIFVMTRSFQEVCDIEI